MKNKLLRAFALFLVILLLSSCSGGTAVPGETGAESQSVIPPQEKETVYVYADDPDNEVYAEAYLDTLPDKDFGGSTFFITSDDTSLFDPDGMVFFSDRVYERNKKVEEKYNIKITTSKDKTENILSGASAAVNSGMYYSDLMVIPFGNVIQFASAGVLTNLDVLPLFDMSAPYFNRSSVSALTIGNSVYGISSEATPTMDFPALFFSFDRFGEDGSRDLYETALSGKLTYDTLNEKTSSVMTDDVRGFVSSTDNTAGFLYQAGGGNIVVSAEGFSPFVDVKGDVAEKIKSLSGGMLSLTGSALSAAEGKDMFKKSDALCTVGRIDAIGSYRKDGASFGVLPIPKMSEEDAYRTPALSSSEIITVTKGSVDITLVSLAISAVSASSYGSVRERYADYMHAMSLPDSESADVIEMMSENVVFDMYYPMKLLVPETCKALNGMMKSICVDNDYSSYDGTVESANRDFAAMFPVN